MFDHRLCSKCISRIATFVFVSSDCSTISCDYPWSFCWTYLGYLISKTATLILIAPINSTQLYLKPRFWNRSPGVANIMRRGQDLGRAILGKLSARELYTCVLIFVPPGSVRCSARKRICCRRKSLSKRKYTLIYRLVFINMMQAHL